MRVADSLFATERAALGPAEDARREALVVVIGSDRGLCGGYNANFMRAAEDEARRAERDGMKVKFYAVGRKALDHLRRAGHEIAHQRINNSAPGHRSDSRRTLPRGCCPTIAAGASARPGVIYSEFRSALSQRPTYEQLLPVSEQKPEEARRDGRAGRLPGRAQPAPNWCRWCCAAISRTRFFTRCSRPKPASRARG